MIEHLLTIIVASAQKEHAVVLTYQSRCAEKCRKLLSGNLNAAKTVLHGVLY